MAWVDILRQRFTLPQQQLLGHPVNQLQLAAYAGSASFFANLIAAAHHLSHSVSPPPPAKYVFLVCLCLLWWRLGCLAR